MATCTKNSTEPERKNDFDASSSSCKILISQLLPIFHECLECEAVALPHRQHATRKDAAGLVQHPLNRFVTALYARTAAFGSASV